MQVHSNLQRFLLPALAALFLLFLTAQENGCSTEEGITETPEAADDAVTEAAPTATAPTDELSSAESEYIDWVTGQSSQMSESMGRIAGLFENPQLLNDDWTIAVAAELALWQVSYQEASDRDAPERFRNAHSKWVEALSRFDAAADLIADGIDNVDAETLDRGIDKMNEGTALIEEATALISP